MKRLVILAGVLLLTGCATLQKYLPIGGENVPPPNQTRADNNAANAPPVVLHKTVPEAAPPGPASAPAPKSKPKVIARIDPEILVGLSREEVRDLIGPPVTIAERSPSRIWSYRADGCSLDIFFYLDVGSSTFRALAFDLTNGDGQPVTTPFCLGRIKAASNGS